MESEGVESPVSIPEEASANSVGKDSWAGVAKVNVTANSNAMNGQRTSWRKQGNIVHGTSKDTDCYSFAADVSLAVYGLAKDTTEAKLKAYLKAKGLDALECKLLTNFVNEARTFTFKVTIKAKDLEKAKEAEIWPYRVGVRMYKHFSTKPKPEKLTFDNQTSQKGTRPLQPAGNKSPNSKQDKQEGIRPLHPVGSKPPSSEQDKQDTIPLSNRFSALQSDIESQFEF